MAEKEGKYVKGKAKDEEMDDQFIEGAKSFAEVIEPHARKIVLGLGLLLAGGTAWAGMDWFKNRGAQQATDAYAAALRTERTGLGEKQTFGRKSDREIPEDPRFPGNNERAEATLKKLGELESGHGGSGAAAAGQLIKADALMDLGKFDEAAGLYESFAKATSVPHLRVLALEGFGYAKEAAARGEDGTYDKGKLEAALTAFANMQPEPEGPRRIYAEYHQARILARMGKSQEAKEKLTKLLESDPGELVEDIQARLTDLGGAAPAAPPAQAPATDKKPAEGDAPAASKDGENKDGENKASQ